MEKFELKEKTSWDIAVGVVPVAVKVHCDSGRVLVTAFSRGGKKKLTTELTRDDPSRTVCGYHIRLSAIGLDRAYGWYGIVALGA